MEGTGGKKSFMVGAIQHVGEAVKLPRLRLIFRARKNIKQHQSHGDSNSNITSSPSQNGGADLDADDLKLTKHKLV